VCGKGGLAVEIGKINSSMSGDRASKSHLSRGSINLKEQNKGNPQEPIFAKQDVQQLIEGINEFLAPTKTHLNFQLHEKLDTYYVQVIDNETKEIVREIPPKKFLDMYASMAELLGLIVDEKI
jgi:flagellar protein FlaG